MAKTVILCNPYGTDVTPWLNGSLGAWKLLKGTVMQPGDTLYTLPYNNRSGIANITAGEALLDAKIRSTSGNILVFSYSEGCQIADKWITDNNSGAYAAGRLSFLSIGNANRVYGGFAYNHPAFATVGFTGGLPTAALAWPYKDFARQYDGIADFPTDPVIQAALVKAQVTLGNTNVYPAAVNQVASVVNNPAKNLAANNAAWGALFVHNWYFNVAPGDTGNTTHTDTNGAVYELAPTFPVPLLGTGVTVLATDTSNRASIESCYSRPMATPTPQTLNWGQGRAGPA